MSARSIEEVRRRVDAGTALPASPFGLITGFSKALNDIGEGLLQVASERVSAIELGVLKREGARHRDDILEIRRDSIQVARDMAYKRIAMLELAHDRPAPFPTDEFDSFNRQIHRYAAQVEEQTNRNLYILTMFSAIFLPATLIAGIWGMNVGGIPFSGSPNGFWVVGGLMAAFFAMFAIVILRFALSHSSGVPWRSPTPDVGRRHARPRGKQ